VNQIMLQYPANSISSNVALELTGQLASHLAKSAAEVLLTSFVARGWLNMSK
jgi:hypothetical protein